MQSGNNDSMVVFLSVGHNYTINCNITEDCPLRTEITLRITGPGHFLDEKTLNITSNPSINFTNIMSGYYICYANNGFGETTFVYIVYTFLPTSSSKCCFS